MLNYLQAKIIRTWPASWLHELRMGGLSCQSHAHNKCWTVFANSKLHRPILKPQQWSVWMVSALHLPCLRASQKIEFLLCRLPCFRWANESQQNWDVVRL